MPSDSAAAVSAFIEGAPPGELADVIADIQKLTVNDPKLLSSVTPAFQKYNEEQLSTVKLPGSGHTVLISPYNSLGEGKYYDVETQNSFAFDHQSQKASDVQPYSHDSEHFDLISCLLKSLSTHSTEHYPSATYTVCPTPSSPNTIALLLVSNKYSPSNFWNGRYRSTYLFTPSSSTLSGTINVDVHYYEDGNVRLTTTKKIPEMKVENSSASSSSAAAEVLRKIAGVERAYQEELNRGFGRLSEGEFKGLRRQLPVTRQKVEWEKIGGYRLGQDIGGGRSR
ncbi:MAG: hypothetical protein L6R38_003526 [Xanthoria sp. 2 TBL-2021]|nr:MAG: hypothetical protein L6R38_003526 [Xanthoria sp. 2 TBL-2021]